MYGEKRGRRRLFLPLFLVLASSECQVAALEALLEEFVDGKGDGLAGGDAHDAGGDALVEGVESLLPGVIVSIPLGTYDDWEELT